MRFGRVSRLHKTGKRLISCYKRVEKLEKEKDVELIFRFRDYCYANSLSDSRILFYLNKLVVISRMVEKSLDELEKEDIEKIVAKISRSYESEWTKHGFKTTIKKFYKWLEGDGEDFPKKVKWIKPSPRKSKLRKPTILSKEEIKRIFDISEGILEKALSTFMYESGCRSPDELLNLSIGDVDILDNRAKVRLVSGKVGERRILLVSSVPYLKEWLNKHPKKNFGKPFWYKGDKPLTYNVLRGIIKKWKRKAHIEKEMTAYTFRRTRATHLSNKWPTPVLYKYMGWVPGSDVIERYVALNEDDVEETVLKFYGMNSEIKKTDIRSMFCSFCGQQNPPDLDFCHFCSNPLTDLAKKKEREEHIKAMLDKMIEKKVEEIKVNKTK